MKLRIRILLGYLLIGLLVAVVGASAIYFLRWQSKASEKILRNNYLSIVATEEMIDALDEMDNAHALSLLAVPALARETAIDSNRIAAQSKFLNNLIKAEGNITETGEKEVLIDLRMNFEKYELQFETLRRLAADSGQTYFTMLAPQYKKVKTACVDLLELNQRALLLRNAESKAVAMNAEIYTLAVIVLSLIIAVGAAARNASSIVAPIKQLTEKIKAVADQNYAERAEVKSGDEIGALALSFNRMAERLEAFEKSNLAEILAEKKRTEAIVKSMSDGIFVLSADQTIVLVNAVGAELFGVSAADVVGKPVAEVAKYNHLIGNLTEALRTNGATKNPSDAQKYLRIFYRGREEFFIKEVSEVQEDEDGTKMLGYIIALKNVTGFKELDEAKSGFVATVSHELRTPLSAINMSLRLLQDDRIGTLNAEQQRLTGAMKQEVKRLLRIVGELLELSRAESGAALMNFQAVDPDSIIDAAITPVLMQAEQKKIQLEVRHEPNLPRVKADVSKIAWVLINLISNAIRYTPEGGRITLAAAPSEGKVAFSVQDTGTGIAPEFLDKIFEKFFQLRPSGASDGHAGVGLGLAVSKEIITGHGGTIGAESEPGKGATFTFTLPVA
ncbi:MAG: HAMP domain-containing protein [Rhizobacter sp.]|nr:HAMP domain-containing protein [Chlorobiales bacterium]